MKHNRMLRITTALFIAIGFFLSSGGYASAAAPVSGGTLKVGWTAQCKTLDPHKSVQLSERYVLYTIFETLVGLDEKFNIVPSLAVSWENPDAKTFLFHLRKNVKFHDGTDFDASVVEWNLRRIMDPEFASPQKKLIEPYVDSIEVVDKYKISIRLKKAYAPFLSLLAERPGFIVSPAAVKKYGDKKFALNPVGTGPFTFEKWLPQSQLTVKKFKNYWGKGEGKPYLDKIIFQEVPDATIRLTMLKAGTVDIITDMNPKQAVEIKKDGKFKLVKMPPARWRSMQWRHDKKPFNNRAFREAVAYGIDREAINKTLFYGEGIPAVGPVVPGLWWYEDGFKGYTYNPELAKKKLTEAGYPNGITQKFYVTNRQVNVQTAEMIQSQLAKVGINAKLVMVNAAESYSRMLSGESDWADPRWTQRSDPHGLLYILFHSKGHANSTKYSNPEVDRLIDEASAIFDQEKRKELYFKAVRLITMDAPYIYIVYVPEWAAMRPEVHGFKWIPDLIPRYSFLWKEK